MAGSGAGRTLSRVAALVRVVCAVVAGVIVAHVLVVLVGADPRNGLVQFAGDWRDSFGWFTRDLVAPSDGRIAEAVDAGLAALVWLVVGSLLSRLIARPAPASKADA